MSLLTPHFSTTKLHFLRMSVYHKHVTQYIFSKCLRTMPRELLTKDLKMYFCSVHGCMVHIFLADHVWFSRMNRRENPFLTQEQFQDLWSTKDKTKWQQMMDFDELEEESLKICEEWIQYVANLDDEKFSESFSYRDSSGSEKQMERMAVLGHIFNHSTHHRGQVSDALHQLGYECDKMDLLYFIRAVDKEILERFVDGNGEANE